MLAGHENRDKMTFSAVCQYSHAKRILMSQMSMQFIPPPPISVMWVFSHGDQSRPTTIIIFSPSLSFSSIIRNGLRTKSSLRAMDFRLSSYNTHRYADKIWISPFSGYEVPDILIEGRETGRTVYARKCCTPVLRNEEGVSITCLEKRILKKVLQFWIAF